MYDMCYVLPPITEEPKRWITVNKKAGVMLTVPDSTMLSHMVISGNQYSILNLQLFLYLQ